MDQAADLYIQYLAPTASNWVGKVSLIFAGNNGSFEIGVDNAVTMIIEPAGHGIEAAR